MAWPTIRKCIPFAAFVCSTMASAVSAQTVPVASSATIARDINGFQLGMTMAEAREISPMTFIGGDQFETEADGIEYNFGVTPVGRIYRVQSTQRLGRFQVDRSFLVTLRSQLSAKYGEPDSAIGETFYWELIEPVTHRDGQRLQFRTMLMSAYIGQQDHDASLEMTLIDFRILWQDQEYANQPNRQQAESRIRF